MTARKFLTESACAVGEMFLIKPPFFRRHGLKAPARYGKTNEKEDFCEKARCA
jgi:hypothetical protein